MRRFCHARPILASLFLALPAHANDSAFWAETGCQLVPVEGQAWVAEVRCQNFLTSMTSPDVSAELRIDGLTVNLDLSQTAGRVPDVFTVVPPDGYVADPPVLVLDEDARGVVRVLPYVGF